jgi:hypothetical protein
LTLEGLWRPGGVVSTNSSVGLYSLWRLEADYFGLGRNAARERDIALGLIR